MCCTPPADIKNMGVNGKIVIPFQKMKELVLHHLQAPPPASQQQQQQEENRVTIHLGHSVQEQLWHWVADICCSQPNCKVYIMQGFPGAENDFYFVWEDETNWHCSNLYLDGMKVEVLQSVPRDNWEQMLSPYKRDFWCMYGSNAYCMELEEAKNATLLVHTDKEDLALFHAFSVALQRSLNEDALLSIFNRLPVRKRYVTLSSSSSRNNMWIDLDELEHAMLDVVASGLLADSSSDEEEEDDPPPASRRVKVHDVPSLQDEHAAGSLLGDVAMLFCKAAVALSFVEKAGHSNDHKDWGDDADDHVRIEWDDWLMKDGGSHYDDEELGEFLYTPSMQFSLDGGWMECVMCSINVAAAPPMTSANDGDAPSSSVSISIRWVESSMPGGWLGEYTKKMWEVVGRKLYLDLKDEIKNNTPQPYINLDAMHAHTSCAIWDQF